MSSPGIKEDPRCAVTSAKKLREGELLHGTAPSPGPKGQCVPRRARVGGLAQSPKVGAAGLFLTSDSPVEQ